MCRRSSRWHNILSRISSGAATRPAVFASKAPRSRGLRQSSSVISPTPIAALRRIPDSLLQRRGVTTQTPASGGRHRQAVAEQRLFAAVGHAEPVRLPARAWRGVLNLRHFNWEQYGNQCQNHANPIINSNVDKPASVFRSVRARARRLAVTKSSLACLSTFKVCSRCSITPATPLCSSGIRALFNWPGNVRAATGSAG